MYYSLRVWLVEDIIAFCPAKTSFTSLVVQKHGEEGPNAMFIDTIFAEKNGINQQTFRRRDRNSIGEQRRTEKYILLDGLKMK